MKFQVFAVLAVSARLATPCLAQPCNPTHVGGINGGASVTIAHAGGIVVDGTIDGRSVATLISDCDIVINGKVDGRSAANIVSHRGSVVIAHQIEGASTVVVRAPNGNVKIGQKIDGGSQVSLKAGGAISLGEEINNPQTVVRWCAQNLLGPPRGVNGGATLARDCN